MKRSTLLVFGVLLFTATCVDDREKPKQALTGPSLEVAVADSAASAQSTVCVAYGKELDAATAQQAQSPDDAATEIKVATLNAIIADACR